MERPLRKDAARHRQALLKAAAEVFAEQGLEAPLELVAERAGVGRATLYRNFADRVELALAVMTQSVEELAETTRARGAGPEVFFDFIEDLASLAARNAGFSAAVRARTPADALASLRAGVIAAGADPLRRALAAGLVRPDFTPGDIGLIASLVIAGASMAKPDGWDQAQVARRSLDLILEGLRPRP
jgi:AcrR family transcriptional regulator